jgi:hypothetical protein
VQKPVTRVVKEGKRGGDIRNLAAGMTARVMHVDTEVRCLVDVRFDVYPLGRRKRHISRNMDQVQSRYGIA